MFDIQHVLQDKRCTIKVLGLTEDNIIIGFFFTIIIFVIKSGSFEVLFEFNLGSKLTEYSTLSSTPVSQEQEYLRLSGGFGEKNLWTNELER